MTDAQKTAERLADDARHLQRLAQAFRDTWRHAAADGPLVGMRCRPRFALDYIADALVSLTDAALWAVKDTPRNIQSAETPDASGSLRYVCQNALWPTDADADADAYPDKEETQDHS